VIGTFAHERGHAFRGDERDQCVSRITSQEP
jgi:hypothetical protein